MRLWYVTGCGCGCCVAFTDAAWPVTLQRGLQGRGLERRGAYTALGASPANGTGRDRNYYASPIPFNAALGTDVQLLLDVAYLEGRGLGRRGSAACVSTWLQLCAAAGLSMDTVSRERRGRGQFVQLDLRENRGRLQENVGNAPLPPRY